MSSNPRSVVVTGIGLVTPLGLDKKTTWNNLVAGQSAVQHGGARVSLNETEGHRAVRFALLAVREALADGGCGAGPLGEEWGCVVSCSKPLIHEDAGCGTRDARKEKSYSGSPMQILEPAVVCHSVARTYGIEGPVLNVVSACATGAHAVMTGAGWLREGRCRAVLAGASESSLHPLFTAGFSQLGVLSKAGKVRPFDEHRDGFVMGEGAAVFVLENRAAAAARGAAVYGTLAGWDFSSDARHATRFDAGGTSIAHSLKRALARAALPPQHVDYVNAHGTGTLLNDALEVNALRNVFGSSGPRALSSTKGATGHLLGAAGAMELAFCLLAMKERVLPPTLNLDTPALEGMDFVPNRSRQAVVHTAASLSFGFGGHIASIVLR